MKIPHYNNKKPDQLTDRAHSQIMLNGLLRNV